VRERVRILIVDQGPGVPPAEQERIFLPFYRAGEGRPHASGSGLGLAITRGFLDLNGGRIRVESVPGQGTTFVVEFAVTGQFEAAVAAMPWRPAAA
jgi:two-component system sensor histidine kinase KdpD